VGVLEATGGCGGRWETSSRGRNRLWEASKDKDGRVSGERSVGGRDREVLLMDPKEWRVLIELSDCLLLVLGDGTFDWARWLAHIPVGGVVAVVCNTKDCRASAGRDGAGGSGAGNQGDDSGDDAVGAKDELPVVDELDAVNATVTVEAVSGSGDDTKIGRTEAGDGDGGLLLL
jgi:hypothetical protein